MSGLASAGMNPAHRFGRIALWALAGAVVGLALGLLLKAAGVVDNPLWLTSAALLTGAALAVGHLAAPADRRPPDDEV
jgi:hypothetical protein